MAPHITARRTDKYLSQLLQREYKIDYLPYGLISKGETGCGATTLPLTNNRNVIVCVPTIPLVENKVNQYPNELCNYTVFGVYGGVTKDEIEEYLQIEQPKKFMCTYDSFARLADTIGDVTEYDIIVDEYPELLTTYSNEKRTHNISSFINTVQNLERVTYVTATPLPEEYKPEFLKDKPELIIDWSNSKYYQDTKQLHLITSNKPFVTITNLITQFLTDGYIEVNESTKIRVFG